MLKLSFKQTQAETVVRAAATVLFNHLSKAGYPLVSLSELSEEPQYGFTASADFTEIGPKFVRITDLQDGGIVWDSVPYCKCDEPEKYLLAANDILFARTGATTGKTHLVTEVENAVFASYLIRLRPKSHVNPEYLYSFFQSDVYWSQILEGKEGSAQPNVNGKKLINIKIPHVDRSIQSAVSGFLKVVRARQDGTPTEFPELPPPIAEQRRIVARIEELVAKVEEARGLRLGAIEEAEFLWSSGAQHFLSEASTQEWQPLQDHVSIRGGGTPSKDNPAYWAGSVPWVCPRDMKSREIVDSFDHISEYATENSSAKLIDPDVVLVVVRGMILAHTVPSAVLRVPATINQDMKAFIPHDNLLPEYLSTILWVMNRQLLELVERSGHDTRKLQTQKLLSFRIPVPSLSEQHRIVAYLDDLQAKVDTLKHLQSETAIELNALIPAILDKAFKGEL